MNRSKLKTYAPQARREFIAAVTARAAKFGITKDKTEPMQVQGNVVLIAGQAHPKKVAEQRTKLESWIAAHGFEQVMEEAAYTWFNRFAAIRYMEVHGYLDHGYRVLSHPEGKATPEIVEHAQHLDLPGLDKDKVVELKLDGSKDGELYRMLLLGQCNALNAAMPFLFERIDNETELLLPDNLLHSDSVIRHMVNEIEESDWQEIEIIGWLYQFYISEKKDQVIGKVVRSEDIPAATQLFTHNWVVKYMVQNTLGSKWLEIKPQSRIRFSMEYYFHHSICITDQKGDAITPESITFLDPACGSGHILVEAYDLYKEIYLECGYALRDVPKLIIENNLFGLEIDERAAQMAAFALLMKGRADDRRILDKMVNINVFCIQDSSGLVLKNIFDHQNYSNDDEFLPTYDLLPETISQPNLSFSKKSDAPVVACQDLVSRFVEAKTFGSLISVPESTRKNCDVIRQDVSLLNENIGKQQSISFNYYSKLNNILNQAEIFSKQFDCVVANPPYMGAKYHIEKLKIFAKINFPDGKGDTYSMFMERGLGFLKDDGMMAMVTMETWMYQPTYEDFRKKILSNSSILSLVHMPYEGKGMTSMGISFGTSAAVFSKRHVEPLVSSFVKIQHTDLDEAGKPLHFPPIGKLFERNCADFNMIPMVPISYSIDESYMRIYRCGKKIGDYAETGSGLQTSDNARFIRFWYEISFEKIGFGFADRKETVSGGKKWFPHKKGGAFRRWYGNDEFVINWECDGQELYEFATKLYGSPTRILKNTDKYFKDGVTWSHTTSAHFSARYMEAGHIFNVESPALFSSEPLFYLALLCSDFYQSLIEEMNPNFHFVSGSVSALPVDMSLLKDVKVKLTDNARLAIEISKSDWDLSETSWGFSRNPVIMCDGNTIKESVYRYHDLLNEAKSRLNAIEMENNAIIARCYNHDTGEKKEVVSGIIRSPDIGSDIKDVISYFFGCLMGRYSLDEFGVAYANSGGLGHTPSGCAMFPADEDGIVPVTQADWFEDDATNRFVEFLKVVWSPETLPENLKFVADCLSAKAGETATDTVRRYISTDFFKDHLKTYKKRPIYWLFSSGKEKAFEALVYLHRYNEGTLSDPVPGSGVRATSSSISPARLAG